MHAANHDENIININGLVIDGALSFSVVTQLGEEVTQLLSQSLETRLKAITSHCAEVVSNQLQTYTPSDFNIQMSQRLLDRLQSQAKAPSVANVFQFNNMKIFVSLVPPMPLRLPPP